MVEKWIPQARRRVDLFGFGDIIALDGQPGSLLIQACTSSNIAARRDKILEECNEAAIKWLKAGNRISIWGWGKRGARGARKLWMMREVVVYKGDSSCPLVTLEESPTIADCLRAGASL